ncbi:spore germination protein [Clostridium tagluense]|uniref:spore germination protein n=1 Tax=Clostridium tagluense TaxID=360422 RepID=UPI001C0DC5B7|nr:spore germination protein [Clostridium tagluense]MBU3127392.1 spore germination protein [Clostridium tagluense]MCB2311134.1 spore germination protein [Clostridium tagluense]MCB2315858.1 spore germination protein [Clostridium tagluense]MCB2320795.1 spore germination protein [Clostridium tagluense]MCB2325812.1 spore germination protein [Clostridium tagluense]
MKEMIDDEIQLEAEKNIEYLKELLKDNSDVIFRTFNVGGWKAAIVYIDGMADKLLLDHYVLEPLMLCSKGIEKTKQIKDNILSVTDMHEVKKLSEGVNAALSGDTLMFIDELNCAYVIATRFWPVRGVGDPSGETVIRGARDGFTETVRFNTALIRRRIRDTRLRVKPKAIGARSKTDVAIMYIDDIVNKEVLEELNRRVDKINIDAVFDSAYIEQLIEDNKYSPFPQIQSTERPDVVAAALYEGRVALVVDNSPFVIIVPTTLPNLFQSPDDYYQRWMHSSMVRFIRMLSIFTSLMAPALYVAITSFHTDIIPTKLAYAIAASREGVPFPAFVEAIIMELFLALLMEAVVRLPKPIGATIGIVGGLVIGQSAVSAGIASPIMIIIVAITAITTFVTPNYEVTAAFRLVRILLIIASAIVGFYGIVMGLIILLIHLVRMKSFGIPYLAPAVDTSIADLKDMYIRAPISKLKERPKYMKTGDKIRQK